MIFVRKIFIIYKGIDLKIMDLCIYFLMFGNLEGRNLNLLYGDRCYVCFVMDNIYRSILEILKVYMDVLIFILNVEIVKYYV